MKILITLGPSTLNKKFLTKLKKLRVNLLRLNMSHLNLRQLEKNILKIRKYTKVPICIDTEGAQIRTKVKKTFRFKKNQIFQLKKGKIALYPSYVLDNLKKNDILDIGFSGLKVLVIKKSPEIYCKVISKGLLENNKGVHLVNRKIKLNYLTEKDYLAINLGKKYKIKYFALSFTNSKEDMLNFNKILKKENKIFKIETKSAVQNIKKLFSYGKNFLIDRGDLSKDVPIEKIPIIQRYILSESQKSKKNIFIATNFLESMIINHYPTRAEINDIYNAFELRARGIVLAAETAIGKYPVECINLVTRIFKEFKKSYKF